MSEAAGPPDDDSETPSFQLITRPENAAGVWANMALTTQTAHEITIDFVRMDPHAPRGFLVARVAMSPILLVRLMTRLEGVWQNWSKQQLPEEGPDGARPP